MDTKSTSIIGAVVLGVLAIGLVLWYMSEHPAPFVNQREVGGQPTTTTTTPSASTSLDEHAKYYDITAAYPSSTPLPPQANAQAIEVMRQFEVNAITAFKEQGNFGNLSAQDIKTFGFDQGKKESLNITYTTHHGARSVSYVFLMSQDTLGAHPNTYYRTLTWDTKTGEGLELADLFTSGEYLTTLSTAARRALPAIIAKTSGIAMNDVDLGYINRGTTADADNFTNWYMEGKNLVLVFPPYQVGPYAIGAQEVPLSLSALAGVTSSYR